MSIPGQLTDAYLGAVRFARNEEWEWEPVQYTIESETNAVLAKDRATAHSTLGAEIKWHRVDDREQIEGPFDLAVDVVGTFAWSEPEATDEDILGWIEFNSQHLLWPYLRSYVSVITAASGLPALTVYTISAAMPTLGAVDDDEGSLGEFEHNPTPPELTQ